MRLCLLLERSIAAAPAGRVKDTLGTGGLGGAGVRFERRDDRGSAQVSHPTRRRTTSSKLSGNANFSGPVSLKEAVYPKVCSVQCSTLIVSPFFSLLPSVRACFSLQP